MMRIAMVCTANMSNLGGVQLHILEVARVFAQDGCQVDVFAPAGKDAHNKMPTGVNLRRVRFPDLIVNVNGSHLNMNFGMFNAMNVVRNIRNGGYDVMHIHEPLQPLVSLWSVMQAPVPTVATWHSYAEKETCGWRLTGLTFTKRLRRMANHDISVPIAVSPAAARMAARYLPVKFRIIPNPVNLEEFATKRPAPPTLDPKHFNVLFVGRLDAPRKGLRTLLGAYSLLKYRQPNVRITVVGSGEPEQLTRAALSERGLTDVNFVGAASREQLLAHYQNADLLCAPSTGGESFGMILTEAMAADLPVAASDIYGYRQVADDNDVLFVKPECESSWAAAIEQVMANPKAAKQRAQHSRRHMQNMSLDTVSRKTMEAYKEAIKIHRQRRSGKAK